MNIAYLFRTWPYSCIWLRNIDPERVSFFCFIGGARGVMVTVVGNRHSNLRSNPRRDRIFTER